MRKKLKEFKKSFLTKEPNCAEWLIAIFVIGFIFLTMFYKDNLEIFSVSFNTNEELFSGKSLKVLGVQALPYGLLHQWICEIWILPVNLLYHLFGIGIDSVGAILWSKLLIAIVFLLCVRETRNIAITLEIDKGQIKWMELLLITSILVTLPVFHVAQTDSLYLFFILKGFHALLQDDVKGFLLWFAGSISFKMLTLFFVIPLILLMEKRIFYVFRNFFLMIIIIPLQHIWYRIVGHLNNALFLTEISVENSLLSSADNSLSSGIISNIDAGSAALQVVEERAEVMRNFYSGSLGGVLYFEFPAVRKGNVASLFVCLFVLLCIWCYVQKKKDIAEWNRICLYGMTACLMIFFVMASPAPYWIVILYPFLFLLFYLNPEKIRLNLLLEKVFTLTTFLVYMKSTYWVYGGAQSFDKLFLTKWGLMPSGHELQGLPYVARYIEKAGIFEFMPIITAMCLASAIGIMWLNHSKVKVDEELSDEYVLEIHHGFAICNISILMLWYVLNIILVGRY